MRTRLTFVLLLSVAGCGPEEVAPDEEIPFAEGSPVSSGVLTFLNGPDATFQALDEDVSLDSRAAENIVAHVRGADTLLGTPDDDLLDSLAELDAISFVGPAAMKAIAEYVASLGAQPDLVVENVALTHEQAAAIIAFCNTATFETLDDTVGLDVRAVEEIVEQRPLSTIDQIAALPYVGTSAIERLRDHAPTDSGAPSCDAPGGTYRTITFSAAEECKALSFINRARVSQMRGLTAQARRVAYDCRPSGAGIECGGYRTPDAWASFAQFVSSPEIGTTSVASVRTASISWVDDGILFDTVATVWAGRAALVDGPVSLERVFAKLGTPTDACFPVRDSTSASATALTVCFDAYAECGNSAYNPTMAGTWVKIPGTLRRNSQGIYRVNLSNCTRAPNPL